MHPSIEGALRLAEAGRFGEAGDLLRRHLRSRPRDADLHHFLAHLLLAAGDLERAEFHFGRGAALAPGNAGYAVGHGVALGRRGRAREAEAAYRRAAELDPSLGAAWLGLSGARAAMGDFAGAADAADRACELSPEHPGAWTNRALALTHLGRGGEAIAALRRGLGALPGHPRLLTQLAADLNYVSGVAPEEVFEAHRRLGASLAHEGPVAAPRGGPGDGVLRVGYFSPDFRAHSVAAFIEPVLAGHDRSRFRVLCFSCTSMRDGVTERLASLADEWIDVTRLDDDACAAAIGAAAPDILVDLAGHTSESRVRLLSRRLAAVQATYLGYPNTTGIPEVDFRIVDSLTDPPGAERLATERLVRLDPCFLCYRPPEAAPEPAGVESGLVRLASFNIVSKVSEACLDAWAAILARAPGAVLRLKSGNFDHERGRADWAGRFAQRGIAADRLELLGHAPTFRGHLEAYRGVSLALDTFPYGGTTTTCEALWMGVPVLTFAGAAHAGRVGLSLLSAAGLGELAVSSAGAYVERAAALAGDPARLSVLRRGLRERVAGSALCDARGFVAGLEAAYARMWRERADAAGARSG